jgi:hypothetical protein
MKECRFEVSDGVTGEFTITGYFTDPLKAYKAFERCHGEIARGVALVYRLDGDYETYAVNEAGGISPTPGLKHEPNKDYEHLYNLACRRADKNQDRADRYWTRLSPKARKYFVRQENPPNAKITGPGEPAQGEAK